VTTPIIAFSARLNFGPLQHGYASRRWGGTWPVYFCCAHLFKIGLSCPKNGVTWQYQFELTAQTAKDGNCIAYVG
jgi:hypothetical protein